jgi:hypothetical protein
MKGLTVRTELEGLLPLSQEYSTGSCTRVDESISHSHAMINTHFNIILSSTIMCCKLSFPFRFPTEIFYAFLISQGREHYHTKELRQIALTDLRKYE